MKIALITGIAGQDGSYLAELLLQKDYKVYGLARNAESLHSENIAQISERIQLVEGDLLQEDSLKKIVAECRPDEIYNLAARASSKTLVSDPVKTGEVNGLAVLRLLDAIRSVNPQIRVCQASSSEMYGKSDQSPQDESTPFRPRNPYGVAKLFAHGMIGAYREHFGIFACSGILFNHESPRRPEHFVTRKITMGVARIRVGLADRIDLGDLEATRDWGSAADYVRGMWQMLQADRADDYVLATGMSKSVREFCSVAFGHVGLDYREHIRVNDSLMRDPEHVRLVGDASRARARLKWKPMVSFEELVAMMVDADIGRVAAAR